MPTMNKIGKHKTKVWGDGEHIFVKYWNTIVVTVCPDQIILDTGGFYTNTTRVRMNQSSKYFNLGFDVSVSKGSWYAKFNKGIYPFDKGKCIITAKGATDG